MEVGAEIARIIIESRTTGVLKDEESLVNANVKEAEHLLSVEKPVRIETLLVHERCARTGVRCEGVLPVETWTIKQRLNQCSKKLAMVCFLLRLSCTSSGETFSSLTGW